MTEHLSDAKNSAAKGRKSYPITRITTEAEFGEQITAEAWHYRYATYVEVYVHVKNATGNWATFRLLVRR